MPALYLSEQGATLCRQGRRLVVRKGADVLQTIPVHRLDRIVLMGRSQITADASALVLDRGIPVVLLNRRGSIRGCLVPSLSPFAAVRKNQYELAGDSSHCRAFAAAVVEAKIHNCRSVLRRYNYNHHLNTLSDRIKAISAFCSPLERHRSVASLMGTEGMASREYFGGLVLIFEQFGMGFGGECDALQQTPLTPFCPSHTRCLPAI